MDIYLKHRGPNLGDNYHFFKMQLQGYEQYDFKENNEINIYFVTFKDYPFEKEIIKIDKNEEKYNYLMNICEYVLLVEYNKKVKINFYYEKYGNEKRFDKRSSNAICVSLGNNKTKKKYMSDEFFKYINNYINKIDEKFFIKFIDYPMTLKEAKENLSEAFCFISNHSGLLYLAYEQSCPCLIYNPYDHGAYNDSINSFMFKDLEEFKHNFKIVINTYKSEL